MRLRRRFNFTNRRRIDNSEIEIELHDSSPRPPTFSVRCNFKASFDSEARLFIEAYCDDTTQRFDFGKACAPSPPDELRLDQISLSGSILFRAKVVDESGCHGRIIASAERIKPVEPDDDQTRSSLMNIRTCDLGEQLWTMEFSDDEVPKLLLNKRIPGIVDRLNNDPVFCALIVPSAMREVLNYMIRSEEESDPDSSDWRARWRDFLKQFAESDFPDEADAALVTGWINDTVGQFCERFGFCGSVLAQLGESE